MKIAVSQTGSYIPKWHGNRKEPESNQIVVKYDNLSWTERQKFIKKDKAKMILDDVERKGDEELDEEVTTHHSKFEISYSTDDPGIVAAMKPRFENLEDDKGNAINTWAELLALPASRENQTEKLIGEITQVLSSGAKEKNSKNSE